MSLWENSVFFGVTVSILSYGLGCLLHHRWKFAIFNPLLISIAATIAVLAVFRIDYDVYYASAKYLSFLPVSYTHLHLPGNLFGETYGVLPA